MTALPVFSLSDSSGQSRAFPTGRHALLCFVDDDCPTCDMSMPLIEGAHRAFGGAVNIWAIGQEAAGNERLVERHGLTLPMLDDTALAVSFAYDIEVVPAIILADERGNEVSRFIGFGREDWRELYNVLARLAEAPLPVVDWDGYPQLRPGCGSRSVTPGIAERLLAEAEGSPLRARRIEIADSDDPFEFMFDQGLTDGLPVVLPTPVRVLRMLEGTRRNAQEVVAVVPPNMAPATVEKVAVNAVMAGCKPEYLPVVIAALEAVCTDEFNIHGVMATTTGASPLLVVNGPIRRKIGMNMGVSVLGQGNRANATIGRALRLVLRNVGGARPGGTERSTLGSPAKYTLSFAEWEERSPWEPLHVERGFRAEESVVTAFAVTSGPRTISDQTSRSARALGGNLGLGLDSDILLVVSPEHVDTLSREGWRKADLRQRVHEVSGRPLSELLGEEESGVRVPLKRFGTAPLTEEELTRRLPRARAPDSFHIVVAGGEAGKFSASFGGWASIPVSRKIEEVP